MSYLDRIRACDDGDTAGFAPFVCAGRRVGWLTPATAAYLTGRASGFARNGNGVTFAAGIGDFAARSAAIARTLPGLIDAGLLNRIHGEKYPARAGTGGPILFELDRASVATFGVASYGVHVNGVVRRADGWWMWIATRAATRIDYPGKLDNMVAGGQPIGIGFGENVVKEAVEEAGIPADLAATARPAGTVSYLHRTGSGIKPDTLLVYDLVLADDFVPRPVDGEAEGFELLPLREVAAIVRDTDRFKFNCALVVIDFMVRHGVLTPENDPDYPDICAGLRRGI